MQEVQHCLEEIILLRSETFGVPAVNISQLQEKKEEYIPICNESINQKADDRPSETCVHALSNENTNYLEKDDRKTQNQSRINI